MGINFFSTQKKFSAICNTIMFLRQLPFFFGVGVELFLSSNGERELITAQLLWCNSLLSSIYNYYYCYSLLITENNT